ncbi:MAG: hypothetical protein QXK80_02760 [Candidatus Pacearchaeota archaeon]
MSDALTDINRDQERNEKYEIFLENLIKYLKNPIKINYEDLENAAKDVDSVGRGYWGSKTNIASKLEEKVKKLLNKDKEEWCKLLLQTYGTYLYEKFKAVSPFKEKTLLFTEEHSIYPEGIDIRIEGLTKAVKEKIKDKKPKEYFYTPKYILIIPTDNLEKILKETIEKAEVICIK